MFLFIIPLGFGVAGVALAVAAYTAPGDTPWWLGVALLASIGGIVVGLDGYDQFSKASEGLEDLQDSFP